jgi:hypothetical protein
MDCASLGSFSDRAFDFVFSSHLLEHIETRARAARVVARDRRRRLPGAVPAARGLLSEHRRAGREPGPQARLPPRGHPRGDARRSRRTGTACAASHAGAGDEYSFFIVFKKLPSGIGQSESFSCRSQRRPRPCSALAPTATRSSRARCCGTCGARATTSRCTPRSLASRCCGTIRTSTASSRSAAARSRTASSRSTSRASRRSTTARSTWSSRSRRT